MQTASALQRTRKQILDHINRHGPSTVEELAQATGVVPVTVRAHLGVLEKDSLIVGTKVRSGRAGRPRIYYGLTPRARDVFPKDYDHLALRLVQAIDGPEARSAVFHRAGAEWASRLRHDLEGLSMDERVEVAVSALDRTGCEAEWLPDGAHLLVRMHNCPYSAVAERFPEICEMERTFLEDLVGVPVRIDESGPGCPQCVLVAGPAAQP
jgi:predicted ArsR family transcriptional regulator